MSELLRSHIQAFGFKHAEIARRAVKLNQATTYRVVEGDTLNPSLNSITGIIEAISLTDADAGVLYRKMGLNNAKPRLFALPEDTPDFDSASRAAKNNLDIGRIRDAAHNVMAMFDLAITDDELCSAYEQAGIVYMGLGRWEEAQVNFEAADGHLQCNLDDPKTKQNIIDRKHTLMTNIGSLMVKRGNFSWALLFGRSVIRHERVSRLNRGWGHLIIGEAEMALGNTCEAKIAFNTALDIFKTNLGACEADSTLDSETRNRRICQARGNVRWSQIHTLKCAFMTGDASAGMKLRKLEADWWSLDPEASTMAGLFHAEQMPENKRRSVLLRNLKSRAQKHQLGEIVKRILPLLCLLMVVGFGTDSPEDPCGSVGAYGQCRDSAARVKHEALRSLRLERGNTGG